MLKKTEYIAAECDVVKISQLDVIATSEPFGKEDWDDNGWTTTVA